MLKVILAISTAGAITVLLLCAAWVFYKVRTHKGGDSEAQDYLDLVKKNLEEREAKRKKNKVPVPLVNMKNLHLKAGSTMMYKVYDDKDTFVGSLSEAFLAKTHNVYIHDLKYYDVEITLTGKPQSDVTD